LLGFAWCGDFDGIAGSRVICAGVGADAKQPQPGPQALWVVNETFGPNIAVFQPAQLNKSGTVGSYGIRDRIDAVGALAFDRSHDLWVGLCGSSSGGYLVELTPTGLRRLVANGKAEFSVTIQDPVASQQRLPEYLGCPQAMQFDPLGNLWVAPADIFGGFGTPLLEYTNDQLRSSGKPVPVAVIETPTAEEFYGRIVLAFDHAGNLWQSSSGIYEYIAAQLAAGVQTDPNQTLLVGRPWPGLGGPSSITLGEPSSIAFYANGNLWVTLEVGGTSGYGGLESFAAADLDGQGTITPTPAITIDMASYRKRQNYIDLGGPDALAFDSLGNLWVGNTIQPKAGLGSGDLVEFMASQLSTSGSPVPVQAILANPRNTNMGVRSYLWPCSPVATPNGCDGSNHDVSRFTLGPRQHED
jgi:hypothetical protein